MVDKKARPTLGATATAPPPAPAPAARSSAGVPPARVAGPSSAAPAPARPKPERPFKVRAIKMGYYGNLIRRIDDVFTIQTEREFSTNWMERVDPRTPEVITGSNAALQREHGELVDRSRAGGHMGDDGDAPTGAGNPLGDD